MKRTSKILSFLMCLALLVSVFSVLSSAASTVNYSVSSAYGSQGDTVTVSVKMSSPVQIWGANVRLSFEPSELKYISCSKGGVVSGGSLNATSNSINFSGMYGAKSGTVFTATFKILKSSGSSTLALSSSENTDESANVYPASCSNGRITISKLVTGISLDKSSVTLKKGETATITPTVTPADATNKTVTYSTSNSKVATVSGGKITAVGGGTATITATAGGKSAKCTVTVKVAQTGIAITGAKNKTITEGNTLRLTTSKVPADATDNFGASWKSSNTSVATVSSNGTVTAVKPGTATITATVNGWTASYVVTINEKPSTTEAESESSTEESTTEESTTEETTTENTTKETTTEETTTEKAAPKSNPIKRAYKSLHDRIFDKTKTVTRTYYYMMTISVGIITAAICIPVTAIVTSNIVKNKGKKKDPEGPEEK